MSSFSSGRSFCGSMWYLKWIQKHSLALLFVQSGVSGHNRNLSGTGSRSKVLTNGTFGRGRHGPMERRYVAVFPPGLAKQKVFPFSSAEMIGSFL